MKRVCLAAIVCWLLSSVSLQVAGQSKPVTMEEMHKLHQDSKAYIASLEDPARDAYQKPHEVITALALKAGERIADIGSGSGYFALRFAQHISPGGEVFAVDVSPDMVLYLNRRIHEAQLDNIRTILSAPDDPLLPAASIDRIFICDTWHHIENHPQYLTVLRKALRPEGQVIVIDFKKAPSPVGPPEEMRVAREDVVKEFDQAGFHLAKEHTFLPYQYFLVFTPAHGSK